MKSHFLLPALSLAASFPAHAQPAPPAIPAMRLDTRIAVNREAAPPRAALPVDVVAGVPGDAQSLHLGRYPLGPNAAPRLVYVWAAPIHKNMGGPHSQQSVFEIDVLAPIAQTGQWKRVSFARYESSNWPDFVEVRFQQPKLQRGAVIALWCSTDYGSTEVNVATLRSVGANSPVSGAARGPVQRFNEDPDQSQRLGLDARGITAVKQTTREISRPATTQIFAWNGRRYAASGAKRP